MTFNRILKIFIVIFIFTLLLAAWFYWRNIYSRGSLKLEILAPSEVELAQEVEYIVKYKNNSSVVLEEPKLVFEYPEGSILEEEQSFRQEMTLEDIYPGEEDSVSFKARLLGRENEPKVARASLSWQPKNLRARYESNTSQTAIIKFLPITFEFDFPSKIEAGRETTLRINYFSNASYPLSNLRIKIEYPPGFEFLGSTPKGLNQDEWEIGLLNKAEGGRIEIRGKLPSEVMSQKIFKAQLVSWQGDKSIVLKEVVKGLELIQPSIYISWQVNGSPQYVANVGDYLHYEVFFKNIGDTTLENLFLRVSPEGGILDLDTVKSDSGQFQKDINTLIWDQTNLPQLRLLSPLEEGKVDFWVKLKTNLPADLKNPAVRIQVDLSKVREDIITKVNSKISLSQRGFFNQDPFQNAGPIPPQVGSATTYTISWNVWSLYNDLRNVKVRTFLPPQTKLTGEFLPKESKLSFDAGSREVVWDVGDLSTGEPGKEIQFQVAFTPTSDQKGQTPDIISQARLTAEDSWTEKSLEVTASAINTTLPDDPSVTDQQGIIQ
jgi:hypothetical protein